MTTLFTEKIIYREMRDGEESAVISVVKQVFNEYVGPDYAQEGIDEFFQYAAPDALKERVQSGNVVLVAERGEELAGVIELCPPDHIAMLFVSVHRHGIAKGLLSLAKKRALALRPTPAKLLVHSSPYAVAIYEKMGFRKSGERTITHGIDFVPMELALKQGDT